MKNALSKITLLFFVAVALLFAGCSPLVTAAEKGDIKEMERLIAAGGDVNEGHDYGSPLFNAAANGQIEAVRFLLEKGAAMEARFGGRTPLCIAAARGHKDVARLLIEKGANVNVAISEMDGFFDFIGKPAIAMIEGLAKEHETAQQAKVAAETAQQARLDTETAARLAAKTAAEEAAFEADFTEAARNYRAATVKPTLPEDARKFKVQAEFAFNKKEFENAAERYKKALDVAPWWPDGHFNRALILGELSRYRDAVREMKKYLTLVPDAPNARAAQDKIYQWEGELE